MPGPVSSEKDAVTKTANTARSNASRITLDETMSVETIGRIHGRFLKCAAKGLDVNIHAQKVVQIDFSALQLLCALVSQVRKNGRVVNWKTPSEVLLRSADITGLSAALGLGGQEDSARTSDL